MENFLSALKDLPEELKAPSLDILEAIVSESKNILASTPESYNLLENFADLGEKPIVGCQGVPGAYSDIACRKLFPNPVGKYFFKQFEDVFKAIGAGEIEFGILPIENSSAGSVSEMLGLLYKHNFFINRIIQIKIEHCFAINPSTDLGEVKNVISHPQALMQCESFLSGHAYNAVPFSNTAAAAKQVAESAEPLGCLCGEESAEIYGLKIIKHSVQDFNENYTRFICISKKDVFVKGSDIISIIVTLPHEPGSLVKLLIRFYLCGMDLLKLISMPIASKDFNVRFYLDFKGNIENPKVSSLLDSLKRDYSDYKFLGFYNIL